MMCNVLITMCMVCFCITAAYLPSYIIPCSKSDPKFQECALKNGQHAIPFLVKGDKNIKLRPLEPFFVPEINIDSNGLNIHLKNSTIKGLGKMQLNNLKLDFEKLSLQLELFSPRFDLDGLYDISGKVLVLPISGNGHILISLFDTRIDYGFTFDLIMKEGKQYVLPHLPEVSLTAKGSSFNLQNLFNGDKQLGDEMNKFLNDNHDVMIKEFGPSISKTIAAIAEDIVKKILTPVPYDEIILP